MNLFEMGTTPEGSTYCVLLVQFLEKTAESVTVKREQNRLPDAQIRAWTPDLSNTLSMKPADIIVGPENTC